MLKLSKKMWNNYLLKENVTLLSTISHQWVYHVNFNIIILSNSI